MFAASCSGLVTVPNGNFNCTSTPSGHACVGTCNDGYSGDIVAACVNSVYTVFGSCEQGTLA